MRSRGSVRLAIALLAPLTACGAGEPAPSPRRAKAPAPEASADAPLVVFLGDSISAGLGVDVGDAFPALLERMLAAEGLPFRLVNAGVSGDTTAGGLRRLDWLLGQHPEALVLELGGNDGLRGQDPAEIEARLREIVERAQAGGSRVLLLGVRLPPSLGADYVERFEAIYPRLAHDLGVEFAPYFMQSAVEARDGLQADGIHPSRAGHAAIAAELAPRLVELLEELPTGRR
jgi:acyl-CoA thioesterase-1